MPAPRATLEIGDRPTLIAWWPLEGEPRVAVVGATCPADFERLREWCRVIAPEFSATLDELLDGADIA